MPYYIRRQYGTTEVLYDHIGPFRTAMEAVEHMDEYGPAGDIINIYSAPEPLMSSEDHITYVLNID